LADRKSIFACRLPRRFIGESFSVKENWFFTDSKFDPTATDLDSLNISSGAQDPVEQVRKDNLFCIEPLKLLLIAQRLLAISHTVWIRVLAMDLPVRKSKPCNLCQNPHTNDQQWHPEKEAHPNSKDQS
jgi:hypothetical protein